MSHCPQLGCDSNRTAAVFREDATHHWKLTLVAGRPAVIDPGLQTAADAGLLTADRHARSFRIAGGSFDLQRTIADFNRSILQVRDE
jgi:hypothetical protein